MEDNRVALINADMIKTIKKYKRALVDILDSNEKPIIRLCKS